MRKFITPSADTTLYQRFPTNNAGLDEILEVGKVAAPEDLGIAYTGSAARAVLNFTLPASGSVPADASYFLNLKIANATEIKINQMFEVYLLGSASTEGSGYFIQQKKNAGDGATWKQATTATSWSFAGGDITCIQQTATLSAYPLQDLRINVSSIIQPIVSASDTFYGFLAKFDNAAEADGNNKGNIKFFSKQTHTVYAPTLEVTWDDSTFVTGSLKPIPTVYDIDVSAKNPRETYVLGTKEKLRLKVRDKYPQKNFDATLRFKNRYYLPQNSYVSIVDTQSNTTIVSYDIASKISCDATGSFFVLDTTPLYKNRYYTANIKIDNGDTDTGYFPELFTFLVK